MKRTKRIAAIIMVGTMLAGSILTTHAACGHANGGHAVWSYTTSADAGSHIYGTGKVCKLTKKTDHYNVVCNDCGATISTYTTSYTAHQVNH